MNTNKAIYWIALAAFAFGMSNEYHRGGLAPAHHVLDRAESVLCHVTLKAGQSLAMAGIFTGDSRHVVVTESAIARQQAEIERAMALREANLARVQAQMDRVQVVLERNQIEGLKALRIPGMRFSNTADRKVMIVCPKTRVRVSVPNVSMEDTNLDIPEITVTDLVEN